MTHTHTHMHHNIWIHYWYLKMVLLWCLYWLLFCPQISKMSLYPSLEDMKVDQMSRVSTGGMGGVRVRGDSRHSQTQYRHYIFILWGFNCWLPSLLISPLLLIFYHTLLLHQISYPYSVQKDPSRDLQLTAWESFCEGKLKECKRKTVAL